MPHGVNEESSLSRFYQTNLPRRHISSKEAVAEVIPLVKVMVDGDPGMADEITGWLDLDDKQSKGLKN